MVSWHLVRPVPEAEYAEVGATVGSGKENTLTPLLDRFEGKYVRRKVKHHSEVPVAVPPPSGGSLGRRCYLLARRHIGHKK